MVFLVALCVNALGAPVAPSQRDAVRRHALDKIGAAHAAHLSQYGAPSPGQTYHDGLYVNDCEDLSRFEEFAKDPRGFSMTTTYLFDAQNGFNIDFTVYVGDASCTPNSSDVFMKEMVRGRVSYQTSGNPNLSRTRVGAKYQISEGDYVLPAGDAQTHVKPEEITLLNQFCGSKCGVDWRRTGSLMHIAAHDCHDVERPMPHDAPQLCKMVTGQPFYNTFTYHNGYFTESEGSWGSQVDGFDMPINETDHINWVQPSRNRDPMQCTFMHASCKDYINQVRDKCNSCDRLRPTDPDSKVYTQNFLECDGCAYRETPDQIPGSSKFRSCCPCFYYYAKDQGSTPGTPFFGHLDC